MTKAEIAQQYEINENGVITSPGKFEREMYYAVYFYECLNEGNYDYLIRDDEEDEIFVFEVNDTDRVGMPELEGLSQVKLFEDSNGFVFCTVE